MARRIHLFALIIISILLPSCGEGDGSELIPPFNLFYSVAVGDLNNDGLQDVATCYTYISDAPPHPGYVSVYLQNLEQPATFLGAETYPVGNDPVSIAIGDLTGDGRPDIVTANNHGEKGVSVLLQDPILQGKFLPVVNYTTTPNTTSVCIGDLNNDGRNDLAVSDNALSILFQDPGSPGIFLPRTTISTVGNTNSVAIADLNGDGMQDLVATSMYEDAFVMLQDPDNEGNFLTPSRYIVGPQPLTPAVCDLNGDGKPDLAISIFGAGDNANDDGVVVLLQNPASSCSFFPPSHYDTEIRAEALAITDLNGDGKADLIVSNSGGLSGPCPPDCGSTGTSVSILLQIQTFPGNFQEANNYPATGLHFITWVAVGDINGDGKPDLVIAQADGVFIRLQDPLHSGQFFAAVPISP